MTVTDPTIDVHALARMPGFGKARQALDTLAQSGFFRVRVEAEITVFARSAEGAVTEALARVDDERDAIAVIVVERMPAGEETSS